MDAALRALFVRNDMTEELEHGETLESIFDDTPKTESENEGEGSPEPKDTEGEEGEQGDKTQESESEDEGDGEAEPPTASEETKHVPVAALQDERRKRQQLEDELKKYRQQQPVKDEHAPDPAEDPEGYRDYIRNQVREEERMERIEFSRATMLEKHDDYEKMEKMFLFLANQDPALVESMNKHPDPARFAYETASAHIKAEREAIKAEIMQELGSKQQDTQPSKAEQRKATAVKMPDLTNAASKGSNSQPVEKDESLDDMFADQKY